MISFTILNGSNWFTLSELESGNEDISRLPLGCEITNPIVWAGRIFSLERKHEVLSCTSMSHLSSIPLCNRSCLIKYPPTSFCPLTVKVENRLERCKSWLHLYKHHEPNYKIIRKQQKITSLQQIWITAETKTKYSHHVSGSCSNLLCFPLLSHHSLRLWE